MTRRLITHVVFSSVLVFAGLAGRTAQASPLKFFEFQANALVVGAGPNNGHDITGRLAWTPMLDFGPMGVRGELGISLLTGNDGSTNTIYNYEGFLRFQLFPPVDIEVGGGMETWSNEGGTHPIGSVNLVFKLIGILDEVFVGYARFFLPAGDVNEFVAGLRFAL